jgi:hypothetical protein
MYVFKNSNVISFKVFYDSNVGMEKRKGFVKSESTGANSTELVNKLFKHPTCINDTQRYKI